MYMHFVRKIWPHGNDRQAAIVQAFTIVIPYKVLKVQEYWKGLTGIGMIGLNAWYKRMQYVHM